MQQPQLLLCIRVSFYHVLHVCEYSLNIGRALQCQYYINHVGNSATGASVHIILLDIPAKIWTCVERRECSQIILFSIQVGHLHRVKRRKCPFYSAPMSKTINQQHLINDVYNLYVIIIDIRQKTMTESITPTSDHLLIAGDGGRIDKDNKCGQLASTVLASCAGQWRQRWEHVDSQFHVG